MNKKYLIILNYLVSIGLLVLLAFKIDLAQITSEFAAANLQVLLLAMVTAVLIKILYIPYIWKKILFYSKANVKYYDLLIANAVSLPLKFLIPFKMSELTRAVGLKVLSNGSFPMALGSSVYLRLMAMTGTFIILSFALFLRGSILYGALIVAACGLAWLLLKVLAGLKSKSESITEIMNCFKCISLQQNIKLFFMALLLQAGEILCAFLILFSMKNIVSSSDLIYYVSLMMLISSIPVSIQGLGVREVSAVAWFTMLPKETAFAFGLMLSLSFHLVPAIAGAFVLLYDTTLKHFFSSFAKEVTGV